MEEKIKKLHEHYYGLKVRSLFLISSLIMLVTYPFFSDLIQVPLPLFLGIIISLVLLGGIINPVSKWVFVLSSIIPMIGLVMFIYYGFYTYEHLPSNVTKNVIFFWTNQLLSLLFFFATYFSVKTLRGMIQKGSVE
jgi:purine-cytosine permease-like protein